MKKLYNFRMFLFVLILALIVPSSTFASESVMGPGEWDYKGQETIIFQYSKATSTKNYYATDGGNFKIDITSYDLNSNSVSASIYINGNYGGTKGVGYSNGNGTIQFSSIPKGAKLWFYISVANYDTINFKFYD